MPAKAPTLRIRDEFLSHIADNKTTLNFIFGPKANFVKGNGMVWSGMETCILNLDPKGVLL